MSSKLALGVAFRDDHDAKNERIERLERSLAVLRSELDAATRRGAEADALRARIADLSVERDALKRAIPADKAGRGRLLLAAVVTVSLAAVVTRIVAPSDDGRAARLAAELQHVTADRDEARRALSEIEDAHRMELGRVAAHPRHGVLVRSRVTSGPGLGQYAVGDVCLLSVGVLNANGPCVALFGCGHGERTFQSNVRVECDLGPATAGFPALLGVRPPADRRLTGTSTSPGEPPRAYYESTLTYDAHARTLEIDPGSGYGTVHAEVFDATSFELP